MITNDILLPSDETYIKANGQLNIFHISKMIDKNPNLNLSNSFKEI